MLETIAFVVVASCFRARQYLISGAVAVSLVG
jgi:hypothetical protein